MLGNGTSCLGARTVRNRNGKANEDKKTERSRREHDSAKNSLTLPSHISRNNIFVFVYIKNCIIVKKKKTMTKGGCCRLKVFSSMLTDLCVLR